MNNGLSGSVVTMLGMVSGTVVPTDGQIVKTPHGLESPFTASLK